MKNKKIVSVYKVIDYKTQKGEMVFVEGTGELAIQLLRKDYSRFSKFVLEGFEIDGTFAQLKLTR